MEIRASMTDLRKHFSEVTSRVKFGGDRVVVERFGEPLIALVSLDDLARIYALEKAEIDNSLGWRSGGGKILNQFRKMCGTGRLKF